MHFIVRRYCSIGSRDRIIRGPGKETTRSISETHHPIVSTCRFSAFLRPAIPVAQRYPQVSVLWVIYGRVPPRKGLVGLNMTWKRVHNIGQSPPVRVSEGIPVNRVDALDIEPFWFNGILVHPVVIPHHWQWVAPHVHDHILDEL